MIDLNNKSNVIWISSSGFSPFICEYLGNYLDVPGNGYIATDKDGTVTWFQEEPSTGDFNIWCCIPSSHTVMKPVELMKVDLNDIPWDTTCHKVTRTLNAVPYTEFPPEERGKLVKMRLVVDLANPSTITHARNNGMY